jgi:protein-tyrosine phosphatase
VNVLVICSGNICRSPMVARYLERRVHESGLRDVTVDSAGTLGIHGSPAAPPACRVMREIGLDIGRHRSKGVSREILASTDVVLGMAGDHLNLLAQRFPAGAKRRLLLRAFENGPTPDRNPPDLPDPIGHDIVVYREQLELIRRCIDHFVQHLEQRGKGEDAG